MSSPFDAYTRYYDLLYRDKDYAAEAAYVAAALRRRRPDARRILELGCGTGGHAEQLAALGLTVHGVDLSDGMVERAQARRAALPPALAQRLSYEVGDARSVRTGERYDAVVSLFHVMSYQTTNADLAAAYATAAAHLDRGGCFLYDYWFGPAVLTQQPGVRVRRLEGQGLQVTRIAEPVLHALRNVCDVHYTLFVEEGATVHRFVETHPMRFLFTPELALLEGGAWYDAEDRAWMGDGAPGAGDWAAMRVITKN